MTNGKKYAQLVRALSIVASILLWVVSVVFSVDGFGILVPSVKWLGWVLALCVTITEMVFLERGSDHTLTLFIVGCLSYLYGIFTNIVGIWKAQGQPDFSQSPQMLIFPIILGFFVEVAAIPLFEFGFTGEGIRDVLGAITGGTIRGH